MEMGSPAQNIPARPFLVPGVQGALPTLIPLLKKAGQQAMDLGEVSKVTQALIRVGIAAASAVQMKITDGPFVPISERTKEGRLRRKAAYQNASEKRKTKMMAKWLGGDFAPLIDTGSLRSSISFVIRAKG